MKLNLINNQLPNIISTLDEIDVTKKLEEKKVLTSTTMVVVATTVVENHQPPPPPPPKRHHLVLHFDINETILIGDEAGGDTVEDCLNKIIAKSAFVQIPKQNKENGTGTGTDTDSGTDNANKADDDFPTIRSSTCCSRDLLSLSNTKRIVPTHWWDGTPIIANSNDGSGVCDKPPPPPPPPLYTGWIWPQNTCPYYRTSYKKKAKSFTKQQQQQQQQQGGGGEQNSMCLASDGTIYRPLYNHLQQKFANISKHLLESSTSTSTSSSSSSLPKSHPFYRMIPSFFHMIIKLQQNKDIQYTLVLRTFGSDLEDIALAITDFANGKHPLFPNFHEPNLVLGNNQLYKGRWRRRTITAATTTTTTTTKVNNCDIDVNSSSLNDNNNDYNSKDSFVFDLYPCDCDEEDILNHTVSPIASGDEEVLDIIENETNMCCGIQDNYRHWDDNHNAPWAGKPVWIHNNKDTSSSEGNRFVHHHLFFDDNIHNDANDSIVAVRARRDVDDKWCSLSGEETIEQQGQHIVRVPTVEAILDDDWFYNKIISIVQKLKNE